MSMPTEDVPAMGAEEAMAITKSATVMKRSFRTRVTVPWPSTTRFTRGRALPGRAASTEEPVEPLDHVRQHLLGQIPTLVAHG